MAKLRRIVYISPKSKLPESYGLSQVDISEIECLKPGRFAWGENSEYRITRFYTDEEAFQEDYVTLASLALTTGEVQMLEARV